MKLYNLINSTRGFFFLAIIRAKTLPRPAKKALLGSGSDANEGYEVVVPSYENMGTKVSIMIIFGKTLDLMCKFFSCRSLRFWDFPA